LRNARVAAIALTSSTRSKTKKPEISSAVALKAFDSGVASPTSAHDVRLCLLGDLVNYKKISASVKRRRFFLPPTRRFPTLAPGLNDSTQTSYFNAFSN
jgi:hypothetical protein